MRRSFFVVEFTTSEGPQISRTFTQIRNARKMREWFAAQTWVVSARIMRGGQGGMLAAAE